MSGRAYRHCRASVNRKPQSVAAVVGERNRKTQTGNDAWEPQLRAWTRQGMRIQTNIRILFYISVHEWHRYVKLPLQYALQVIFGGRGLIYLKVCFSACAVKQIMDWATLPLLTVVTLLGFFPRDIWTRRTIRELRHWCYYGDGCWRRFCSAQLNLWDSVRLLH